MGYKSEAPPSQDSEVVTYTSKWMRWLSSDQLITGSNGSTFYLRSPVWSKGWKMKLHQGTTVDGELLHSMIKTGMGEREINILSADGALVTNLFRPSWSRKRVFHFNGHLYVWKSVPGLRNKFHLSETTEGEKIPRKDREVLAEYKTYAQKLTIFEAGRCIPELVILLTGIAMGKLERQRNSAAASSGAAASSAGVAAAVG